MFKIKAKCPDCTSRLWGDGNPKGPLCKRCDVRFGPEGISGRVPKGTITTKPRAAPKPDKRPA